MSIELIQQRLLEYNCKTVVEQENALKEILQEIALMALSRSEFFRIAAFQGGTCLRIFYGLERFSEDLDFVLQKPDKDFDWDKYVKNMEEEFSAYGFSLEVNHKKNLNKAVRSAFLKSDSKGGFLFLQDKTNGPKIKIKLEIDTNPPEGSNFKLKYLDFPLSFSVQTQDTPSLFASKIHALLCRDYAKGRDWYDFIWYVSRKTQINFFLLNQAIKQAGPWGGANILRKPEWFLDKLRLKIKDLDWNEVRKDIARFLRVKEVSTLDVWSEAFFLSRVDKLETYLSITDNH